MSRSYAHSDSSNARKTSKSFVDRPEDEVTHSKEDALNEREFELLVEASYRLDGDYFELESRWVLFAAGRLGLRAGEIAHMQKGWIDPHDEMIRIPRHYACDKGKDGGICGYCRSAAKSMVTHNEGLTQDEAESLMWSPKTEAGARGIPLNASTRAKIAMERYFARFLHAGQTRNDLEEGVKRDYTPPLI